MRKEVSTIDTTGLKSPLLLTPAPCPETISGLLPFRFHVGFRGRGLVLRGFSGFPFFLLTQSTVQCSSVGCMAKPCRSFNLQKRFFSCNYIVSMRGRSFAVQPNTMVFLSVLAGELAAWHRLFPRVHTVMWNFSAFQDCYLLTSAGPSSCQCAAWLKRQPWLSHVQGHVAAGLDEFRFPGTPQHVHYTSALASYYVDLSVDEVQVHERLRKWCLHHGLPLDQFHAPLMQHLRREFRKHRHTHPPINFSPSTS